jgi:indolepyruvate ferredoxin oxidoreductase beta subunit
MKSDTMNVLMAGVGGQGVLLASEILARAAMVDGFEVKQSEVHGVAQRGGTVVSHVRFGATVRSPLIRRGHGDVLYALDRLECLRFAHYLRCPGGRIFMDERLIEPVKMSEDAPAPPATADVLDFLRNRGFEPRIINAFETATALGEERCANVVLIGALASALPISDEAWHRTLHTTFPAKLQDLNDRAFREGRNKADAYAEPPGGSEASRS